MLEKVPKVCITCQYYKPYRCTFYDCSIGYIYADLPRKCEGYSLSEHYRKGGKFYKDRLKGGRNEETPRNHECENNANLG